MGLVRLSATNSITLSDNTVIHQNIPNFEFKLWWRISYSSSSGPSQAESIGVVSTGATGVIDYLFPSGETRNLIVMSWSANRSGTEWSATLDTSNPVSSTPIATSNPEYSYNLNSVSTWDATPSVVPDKPVLSDIMPVYSSEGILTGWKVIDNYSAIDKKAISYALYYAYLDVSNPIPTVLSSIDFSGIPRTWRKWDFNEPTAIEGVFVNSHERLNYWIDGYQSTDPQISVYVQLQGRNSIGTGPKSDIAVWTPTPAATQYYTLTMEGVAGATLSSTSFTNCNNIIDGESCSGTNLIAHDTQSILITLDSLDYRLSTNVIVTPSNVPWVLSRGEDSTLSNLLNSISITNTVGAPLVTVTPQVLFISARIELSVEKGSFIDAKGALKIVSPDIGDNYSSITRTPSIPDIGINSLVSISAKPNNGYKVKQWMVDGVVVLLTDSSVSTAVNLISTISIEMDVASKSVSVEFEELSTTAIYYTLTIGTSGSGSTSPLSGQYIENTTVLINPIPASGWAFVNWTYPSSFNFSLNGNTLSVTMTGDITSGITANFEETVGPSAPPPSPPGEPPTPLPIDGTSTLREQQVVTFYCPSENYKNNIVAFNFTNNNEDPSIDNNYHFRVNFYTDISKDKLVYSAFSLADNKRWFLDTDFFSQLSSDGLNVGLSETVSIVYDPEALPIQMTEYQKSQLINNNSVTYEKPLICGVQYYVEVQAYELSTNSITTISTIPIMLDCNKVDSYYWNYNKDKNNWLCSGQGKTDLQVCGGFSQAINSSIASNVFGIFKIVWQGRKNNITPNIYAAVWDSSKDILYSSAQGLYDILELADPNVPISNPIVVVDPALNFYITGTTRDDIKYKSCSLGVCDDSTVDGVTSTASFETFCYPGESTLLGSSYDQIKMRVYKEDISGSIVINDNKTVSVVSKKSIRLDIDGIVGAYAVRIRNTEDADWGEWINIDNELSTTEAGDDIKYDAYSIDNSRFLVGWGIESNNGLRRICCQVLTIYGISNTFCMELLANFDVAQHVFKFYTAFTRLPGLPLDTMPGDEFPTYNGQYVLSKMAPGVVINEDNSVTVYFDAIFSDVVYKDEINEILYDLTDVKFNVVQQGVNDLRSQLFTTITKDKFSGQFNIYNNDGIFNKDGAAFIEILFPGSSSSESCGSDEIDTYNLVNSDLEEASNIDLLPEEVYKKYQSDKLSKGLDVNKFKQYYDRDDTNFKFGNSGYYRK